MCARACHLPTAPILPSSHSTTAEMIFGCAELVSYLSRVMTLEPGDLIATGTCAGVGIGFDPPRVRRVVPQAAPDVELRLPPRP